MGDAVVMTLGEGGGESRERERTVVTGLLPVGTFRFPCSRSVVCSDLWRRDSYCLVRDSSFVVMCSAMAVPVMFTFDPFIHCDNICLFFSPSSLRSLFQTFDYYIASSVLFVCEQCVYTLAGIKYKEKISFYSLTSRTIYCCYTLTCKINK